MQALIEALGLSEQFASTEEFLAALAEIEILRSQITQTESNLTLSFDRLNAAEGDLSRIFFVLPVSATTTERLTSTWAAQHPA